MAYAVAHLNAKNHAGDDSVVGSLLEPQDLSWDLGISPGTSGSLLVPRDLAWDLGISPGISGQRGVNKFNQTNKTGMSRFPAFGSPFSSKVVVYGHTSLVTLPLAVNEALKRLPPPLPILMLSGGDSVALSLIHI